MAGGGGDDIAQAGAALGSISLLSPVRGRLGRSQPQVVSIQWITAVTNEGNRVLLVSQLTPRTSVLQPSYSLIRSG